MNDVTNDVSVLVFFRKISSNSKFFTTSILQEIADRHNITDINLYDVYLFLLNDNLEDLKRKAMNSNMLFKYARYTVI